MDSDPSCGVVGKFLVYIMASSRPKSQLLVPEFTVCCFTMQSGPRGWAAIGKRRLVSPAPFTYSTSEKLRLMDGTWSLDQGFRYLED